MPDETDPPDLEFYSGNGFWYYDRSYMMVLNYAASPLAAKKHGPQMDTEWWAGRDGLRWERPARGINATGAEVNRITHNPMVLNGRILFHFGNRLLSMKQDRISYVGARANAEFSTVQFQMPAADLCLNAAIPSPDRAFAAQQAYVTTLRQALCGVYFLGEQRIDYEGASFGVIICDPQSIDVEAALRAADEAMYQDKKSRRQENFIHID